MLNPIDEGSSFNVSVKRVIINIREPGVQRLKTVMNRGYLKRIIKTQCFGEMD